MVAGINLYADTYQLTKRIIMTRARLLLSTAILVIIIVIVGGEVIVRFIDKPDNRVCQTKYITTDLCTQYWKETYIATNSGRKIHEGNFDPDLGWDKMILKGRTRSGQNYTIKPADNVTRIVTIGDSNAWGDEVEGNETFSHYLSNLKPGLEALNMGVSAYGIDQAVLKYLQHGKQYEPDYVVLAWNFHDYIRTGIKFFTSRKPFLEEQGNGQWKVTNTPIAPPPMFLRK